MKPNASVTIELVAPAIIVLHDHPEDEQKSVTNDARAVIRWVSNEVGGIGKRRVVYRDSIGQYDELLVANEHFVGFGPCSLSERAALRDHFEGICTPASQ